MTPTGIGTAWNRHCELTNMNQRAHEPHKLDLSTMYSVAMVQRFKPILLPDAMKKKIRRNIERGFAHGRGGNTWIWTALVANAAGIRIGTIARDHMDFWIYQPSPDFVGALEALCGLTGKARLAVKLYDNDWAQVWGRSRPNKGEGPAFAEIKTFVEPEFARYRAMRMPALDALDTPKYIYITARFPK